MRSVKIAFCSLMVTSIRGCSDSRTARDSYGDNCSYYSNNPSSCGFWDDSSFMASRDCCASCGGSSNSQYYNQYGYDDYSYNDFEEEAGAGELQIGQMYRFLSDDGDDGRYLLFDSSNEAYDAKPGSGSSCERSLFYVREGLASDGSTAILGSLFQIVSFESVSKPNHYLRHAGYTVQLNPDDESELFKLDATFMVYSGLFTGYNNPNAVAFVSINYPDYVLHHDSSYRVRITDSDELGVQDPNDYPEAFWVPEKVDSTSQVCEGGGAGGAIAGVIIGLCVCGCGIYYVQKWIKNQASEDPTKGHMAPPSPKEAPPPEKINTVTALPQPVMMDPMQAQVMVAQPQMMMDPMQQQQMMMDPMQQQMMMQQQQQMMMQPVVIGQPMIGQPMMGQPMMMAQPGMMPVQQQPTAGANFNPATGKFE